MMRAEKLSKISIQSKIVYIGETTSIYAYVNDLMQKRLTKVNGKELNEGLTVVEGSQWKRIRSTMTPTFSTAKLRQMTYIMDRCVDNAAAALERKIKSNDGVFNSKTYEKNLCCHYNHFICNQHVGRVFTSLLHLIFKLPSLLKNPNLCFTIS